MVAPFRLKITEKYCGCHTYITRSERGTVRYLASDEMPLALSNLLLDQTAETRFRLEDCEDANKALAIMQEVCKHKWRNNPSKTPDVKIL